MSETPANPSASAIDAFTARMQGPVLAPGDPGCDTARGVWNGMIDKHPALIARYAVVADVISPPSPQCPTAERRDVHAWAWS